MAQGKPVNVTAIAALALATLLATGSAPTDAHDTSAHQQAPAATASDTGNNTPGFPAIKGGDFKLIDARGQSRTARDPQGRPQLLFFGYANCQAICSVALPRIAKAIELLDANGVTATPVLITVDPGRDTVTTLGPALAKIHQRFVGLTGSMDALETAYRAFQVERKVVFTHPEYGDVYAHGSYVYLLDGAGNFLTLLPPVLSPERIAEIATGYVRSN